MVETPPPPAQPEPASPPLAVFQSPTELPATEGSTKSFNWGAFWLTWIWGIGHGLWLCLLLIPLAFSAFLTTLYQFTVSFVDIFFGGNVSIRLGWVVFGVVVIINLLISIWFGKKGNEWAWSRRGSRDSVTIQQREKVWTTVGWVFGALVIVGWILTITSLISNGSKTTSADCAPGVTLVVNGVDQCAKTK